MRPTVPRPSPAIVLLDEALKKGGVSGMAATRTNGSSRLEEGVGPLRTGCRAIMTPSRIQARR
jgi:hypothetical protein